MALHKHSGVVEEIEHGTVVEHYAVFMLIDGGPFGIVTYDFGAGGHIRALFTFSVISCSPVLESLHPN